MTFQDTPNNRNRCEELLMLLHKEIRAGHGDSDLADAYRNEMDSLWKRLNDQDRMLINALSADLYMIADDEIKLPLEAGETEQALEAEARRAFYQRRWLDVLALHRKIQKTPPHIVAYVRSRGWEGLGFSHAAASFLEWACEQQSEHKISYAASLLTLYVKCGRFDDALALMDRYLESDHATFLAMSILVLYEIATKHMKDHREQKKLFTRMISISDRLSALAADASLIPQGVWFAAAFAAGALSQAEKQDPLHTEKNKEQYASSFIDKIIQSGKSQWDNQLTISEHR